MIPTYMLAERAADLIKCVDSSLSLAFRPGPLQCAGLTARADRILMPAFSTMNTRNMFDDMVDVILQLVQKWERYAQHAPAARRPGR